MDGVSITSGPLGFIQERDIGLGHIVMDVLQSDTHGTNGYGEILEAGEQVKQVMGSQGKFRRPDALGAQLQCPKRQGRCQSRRGRGEGTPRAGGCCGGDMSGLCASQLQGIG